MHDESLVAQWLADPASFVEYFWPDSIIYDRQYDVMLSVRDNSETFVHTGNELGKTKVAAWIVLHWFCTRFPAKVVTSSSSERQLKNILWSEIDVLIRTARRPLGIEQQTLRLSVIDPDRGIPFGDTYVVGHVTNTVENFQGHHLAMEPPWLPRVFFLFDETSGVGDAFYDAAQSQAQRMLALGNPLSTEGFFYRMCKKGNEPDPDRPGHFLRKVIHIDGLDSPNVQLGMKLAAAGFTGVPPTVVPGVLSYSEYRRRDRIWDPVKKQMRLHGLFYEGEEYLMFPPSWLDAAEDAWEQIAARTRGPCWMGVDTAEGGSDLTAWYIIDWLGIVGRVVKRTRDTAVIVPSTIALMAKYKIPARRVCFDYGGGGKQHADALRKMGYRVRLVTFGGKATDPKAYKNRRAEIYGLVAKAINPVKWIKQVADGQGIGADQWSRCLAIPAEGSEFFDPELREELAVLPTLYDQEGKQYLPPKRHPKARAPQRIKSIEEMIGRSPDRADALALAVYCRDGSKANKVQRVASDRVMAYDPAAKEDATVPAGEKPRNLVDRLFGPVPGAAKEQVERDWTSDMWR